MTPPPDSNVTLPEVWRALVEIKQSTSGLGGKIDDLRTDMDHRLSALRDQLVPRYEFEDHKRQAEAAMRDVRGDILDRLGKIEKALADAKKSLGDRLSKLEDGTRFTVWDLITRFSPVIATIIVLIATLQLRP